MYTNGVKTHTLQLLFVAILLAGLSIVSFFIFSPFLIPVVLGIIFAIVLYPLYLRSMKYFGKHESFVALIMVIVSAVFLVVPLVLIGLQILTDASDLYISLVQGGGKESSVAYAIQKFGTQINPLVPGAQMFFFQLSQNLTVYVQNLLTWIIDNIGAALTGVSSILLYFFIFFVSLYYFLKDGLHLKQALMELSPLETIDEERIFKRFSLAVNSVIKGNFATALLHGITATIGFSLFGVHSAVLWGTVAAFASLIPPLSAAIVLVPVVAFLYITGSVAQAVGLFFWGALIIGIIDNIIKPVLMGRSMELHPLAVMVSILGGMIFFGPVGVLLGPLTLSLLLTFSSTYSHLANPAKNFLQSKSLE